MLNRPRIVKIEKVIKEAESVRTLMFWDEPCSKAKPGQFIMVWISEVDEIPLSISIMGPNGMAGVTVKEVGEATRALCKMKEGDKIGIRGPYGNFFEVKGKKALLIAGGIGVAPLAPFTELLIRKGVDVTFLLGAKSANELVFVDRIQSVLYEPSKLLLATEDGTCGIKGLVTDLLEALCKEEFSSVYTCGKELMMLKVFEWAEKRRIPIQVSLERYMKCGIGICGHCILDPLGLRVCKDGPVFNSRVLRELMDFGRYKRDASGRKVPV